MQSWCDSKGSDTVMHPIPKWVIFLESLLQEMVDKNPRTPLEQLEWPEKHFPRSGIALRSLQYQPNSSRHSNAGD